MPRAAAAKSGVELNPGGQRRDAGRADRVALRETAPDGANLEVTYEAWLNVFEDGLATLRAIGVIPQRIAVDLPVFTEWCESVGRAPDSAARAAFVSEHLRRRDGLAPSSEG